VKPTMTEIRTIATVGPLGIASLNHEVQFVPTPSLRALPFSRRYGHRRSEPIARLADIGMETAKWVWTADQGLRTALAYCRVRDDKGRLQRIAHSRDGDCL
jgi:hypothetical protein